MREIKTLGWFGGVLFRIAMLRLGVWDWAGVMWKTVLRLLRGDLIVV